MAFTLSPYSMMDGFWGGFGPPSWFQLDPANPRNVFEYDRQTRQWSRIWDQRQKLWRALTPGELALTTTQEIEE